MEELGKLDRRLTKKITRVNALTSKNISFAAINSNKNLDDDPIQNTVENNIRSLQSKVNTERKTVNIIIEAPLKEETKVSSQAINDEDDNYEYNYNDAFDDDGSPQESSEDSVEFFQTKRNEANAKQKANNMVPNIPEIKLLGEGRTNVLEPETTVTPRRKSDSKQDDTSPKEIPDDFFDFFDKEEEKVKTDEAAFNFFISKKKKKSISTKEDFATRFSAAMRRDANSSFQISHKSNKLSKGLPQILEKQRLTKSVPHNPKMEIVKIEKEALPLKKKKLTVRKDSLPEFDIVRAPKPLDETPIAPNIDNMIKIEQEANEAEFEPTFECSVGCGKSFKESALRKHERICKKVFMTKRKKFDISKKRGASLSPNPVRAKTKPKIAKENWKHKSKQLREIIKENAKAVVKK